MDVHETHIALYTSEFFKLLESFGVNLDSLEFEMSWRLFVKDYFTDYFTSEEPEFKTETFEVKECKCGKHTPEIVIMVCEADGTETMSHYSELLKKVVLGKEFAKKYIAHFFADYYLHRIDRQIQNALSYRNQIVDAFKAYNSSEK